MRSAVTIRTATLLAIMGATGACSVGATPADPPATSTPSMSAPEPITPTPTPTPSAAPVVGDCRDIPDGGFLRFTDQSEVTDCAGAHSAETIWVGEVSGPEADEDVPDYLVVVSETACSVRLTEHLGTADWVATRLTVTAFVAPLREWGLGARWVRCDAYVPEHGETGYRSGVELFTPIRLDDTAFSTWRYCTTYDPDTPELAMSVDCADPHNAEAVAPTLDLEVLGPDFPASSDIAAVADEHCFGAITDDLGGSPPEALVTWVEPSESQWELGDRYVVCYVEIDGGRVAGSLEGVGDQIEVIPFAEGEDDPAIDSYDSSSQTRIQGRVTVRTSHGPPLVWA